jgi:serine/threonine protein kinase
LLEEAIGSVVSERFRLVELLAVGRQSYVYLAHDAHSETERVMKLPSFDFRRPLLYGRREAAIIRDTIKTEYQVLRDCPAGFLPEAIALVEGPSPVPAAQDSVVLATGECGLVEELIRGSRLDLAALREWPQVPPERREDAARRVASGFVDFWRALESAGWIYTDISASNIMLQEIDESPRFVDGGSAVRASSEVIVTGYSPAFTTPRLYSKLVSGQPLPATLASFLPALAKVLHFALTRKEPHNGTLPDVECRELSAYTPDIEKVLSELLDLDEHPEGLAYALEVLGAWTDLEP